MGFETCPDSEVSTLLIDFENLKYPVTDTGEPKSVVKPNIYIMGQWQTGNQ